MNKTALPGMHVEISLQITWTPLTQLLFDSILLLFLGATNLFHYKTIFIKEDVDYVAIFLIEDKDLDALGLTPFEKFRYKSGIELIERHHEETPSISDGYWRLKSDYAFIVGQDFAR